MPKQPLRDFSRQARPILGRIRKADERADPEQRLLALHALGKLLRSCSEDARYGEQIIVRLASVINWRVDSASRLRQLATTYTASELRKLVRGVPHLSLTHALRLASVPSPSQRGELVELLRKHHWSAARLHAEITSRLGRRRQYGRPPDERTPSEAIRELREQLVAVRRTWTRSSPIIARKIRSGATSTRKALRELVGEFRNLRDELDQLVRRG